MNPAPGGSQRRHPDVEPLETYEPDNNKQLSIM